jgi:anaerobic magnesium-protoporphyrin IX monomethyl ester cyclase
MPAQLYLVNPPARKGFTHERAQSGGIGVARKRKLFEPEMFEVLPHDFLYQAAVAERAGHRVTLIDLPLEHIYDVEHGLAFTIGAMHRSAGEPIWIGVRFSMPTLRSDIEMANRLKEALPSARVYAFGNVLMTTYLHWIADARFDYILYGEPEAIIGEALAAPDPIAVAGVIDVASHVQPADTDLFSINSAAEYRKWRKVADLRLLPQAAWHLLELSRYASSGRASDVAISVPASRGCFMPCTMCAYNLLEGREMRFRTAEEVLDEIEFLYHTYGIRQIRFRDPNFSANRPLLQAIGQGLLDRGLEVEAAAELALELLDRKLLELMYRSGIRTILTGVESSDAEIMESIGQNVRTSHIVEDKLAICRELGMKVYTFFLIGAPEETWHTVRETIAFAKRLGTEATMTTMTPFPGTPMYWRALYEGLLVSGKKMRYDDWNSYTATMRTYQLSVRDVELARTWARLETYVPNLWRAFSSSDSVGQKVRTALELAPRVATLAALRVYASRKLREEAAHPAARPPRVNVVAGRGLVPIPVLVSKDARQAS